MHGGGGVGVSLVPRTIVELRRLRDSVGVHAVPPRFAKIQTLMIWRKDAEANPARKAFLETLRSTTLREG